MVKWHIIPKQIDYTSMLHIMEQKVDKIINGASKETVYLLEHNDVYTAGTNADQTELLTQNSTIPIINVGRGGKYTYHGKGQRIIYPILNLSLPHRQKDVKLYVRKLEQWIINTLKEIDIDAYTINDMVGIWVKHKNTHAKIAAIGIRIRKWVTYHGISINIYPDLNKYLSIVPCGIRDFPVTSLKELGLNISFSTFDNVLIKEFGKIF